MPSVTPPCSSKLVNLNSYASSVVRIYNKFKHDPTRLIALMESIEKMEEFMKQEREMQTDQKQLKLTL